MLTYKQAIIVAGASTASAIKSDPFIDFDGFFGDDSFVDFEGLFGDDAFVDYEPDVFSESPPGPQLDEGDECRLWWNSWASQGYCRDGLECRDQGAESIDGFGKCDDPELLGE